MKRKVLTLLLITLITNRTFAQDARSAMNQILDGYTLPMFVAFMLAGIVLGLVQQWDNIIDKDNRGTRKDGLFALAWYVGYALVAAIVVTAVKSAISGISLQV
jgi:putative transmembrane protein